MNARNWHAAAGIVARFVVRRCRAMFLGGGCSSVGRVLDCDSSRRGFESHQPPHLTVSCRLATTQTLTRFTIQGFFNWVVSRGLQQSCAACGPRSFQGGQRRRILDTPRPASPMPASSSTEGTGTAAVAGTADQVPWFVSTPVTFAPQVRDWIGSNLNSSSKTA